VDFRNQIAEVLILDDASHDDTFSVGRSWAARADTPPTLVVRHTKNLGYGGNQKAGYALAMERGLDIVVMLHGDGQYAPELLPEMVAPLVRGECDAVFGSRMMRKGSARRGGMPYYKRIGNQILTWFENRTIGTGLTEFHSGYRAYRVNALRDIPLRNNTDDFDFDTQIIIQLAEAGKKIVEIPIPTHYGDEICRVDGLRYAKDVVKDVVESRLAHKGFGTTGWLPTPEFSEDDGAVHAVLSRMLKNEPAAKILDLGCSDGLLTERVRAAGHHVTGVDLLELPGVRERTDDFYQADLSRGIPPEAGVGYDVVIAADLIERLPRPAETLREILRVLRPGGQLLLSVPNFGHWYPRVRVALGLFGYDRRGVLDQTHLRFFTRSSLRRFVRGRGFDILGQTYTGLPLVSSSVGTRMLRKIDNWLAHAWPTFFGYQLILRLTPHAENSLVVDET
jgi:SAM-dependent methyltransferase